MTIALITVSLLCVLGWYRASVWKRRCVMGFDWGTEKDVINVHWGRPE